VRALERAAILATSELPVLVFGETGTGKELVAKLVHRLSRRSDGPLVSLDCGAIPLALAESTLFGHEKGSFTGATSVAPGRFKLADGGTLFLDEVGNLSAEIQVKLLRALQEGEIAPLGAPKPERVDVRVIAATSRDLAGACSSGVFREDLYYRLSVGEIHLPALRDRRSDIPKLAIHFLDEANSRLRKARRFAPETLRALHEHDWPGNIRELQNAVQRATLLCKGEEIRPEDLELRRRQVDTLSSLPTPHEGFSLEEHLKEIRLQLLQKALRLAEGNQSKAARLLGVTPQAVSRFVNTE
jgi:transcriptional regulator with GAF, ATPase, and Fis domain